jgi:hypothetical protein
MATEHVIHNLMIRPDGLIEITYALDTDEVTDAALLRTIVFVPDRFATYVSEVMEDLETLIAEVERFRLNPQEDGGRPSQDMPTLNSGSDADFDAKDF